MRVAIFSKKDKKEFQDIISFLEEERLVIVDYFKNMDETSYCIEMRKYDSLFIESEKNMLSFVNLLKTIKIESEENNIKKVFFGKDLDKKRVDYYLKDDYCQLNNNTELLENVKRDIKEVISYKNITIIPNAKNVEDKKKLIIYIEKDGVKKKIKLKTKIDYFLMTYFLRHYEEKINVHRLIDAIAREPELTKSSTAETSISSIRSLFKKELNVNPITAYKKIGYQFAF